MTDLERALADVEMLTSAYPDETTIPATATAAFPLSITLHLSEQAHCVLQYVEGYPERTNIQIASYRCSHQKDHKARMQAVLEAVRTTAAACLEEGMEGGLSCCAAALEAWNESPETAIVNDDDDNESGVSTLSSLMPPVPQRRFVWHSGDPLLDRKSTFQAHVCRMIQSESDVSIALQQLLDSSNKFRRATHNMVRVCCVACVW